MYDVLGTIFLCGLIGLIFIGWDWCTKSHNGIPNWRFEVDRRKAQHPILFPCRRKTIRRTSENPDK